MFNEKGRRNFLKKSALLGVGMTAIPGISALGFTNKKVAPSDRLNFGLIGAKGMGWANLRSSLRVAGTTCLGISDVDASVLAQRTKSYAELRDNKLGTYNDYRRLLDNKDIDVIIIGTPDHWHCKMMVDAVQAGKHVYVEKPIANTIEECNVMTAAARKYGKLVQVGQWQRSGPHYRSAIDIVRSGKLGKIRLVKVWAYQGWMKPIPKKPDSAPPKGVDYKMWLGPAPMRPFNENRFHFNFRWFWDYAGGLMTDWGVHEIDIALYAMNAIAPVSVMASGGKFAYPDDASETPDTLQAVFEYEDFNMLWEHAIGIDSGPYGRTEGIAFIGNNGTLVVNRNGYEIIQERRAEGYAQRGDAKMEHIDKYDKPGDLNYLDLHTSNFIESIRANDYSMLNTNIQSGSVAAINAQMGNISYKLGRKLYWDKEKGSFRKDKKANKLMKANYHNGWKLPTV